jgi:hypothetical protein
MTSPLQRLRLVGRSRRARHRGAARAGFDRVRARRSRRAGGLVDLDGGGGAACEGRKLGQAPPIRAAAASAAAGVRAAATDAAPCAQRGKETRGEDLRRAK